jgi:hypothetical protein
MWAPGVAATLTYDIATPAVIALQIAAARRPDDETLTTTVDGSPVAITEVAGSGGPLGGRTHLVTCGRGQLVVTYAGNGPSPAARAIAPTAFDRIVALRPSRYCPSTGSSATPPATVAATNSRPCGRSSPTCMIPWCTTRRRPARRPMRSTRCWPGAGCAATMPTSPLPCAVPSMCRHASPPCTRPASIRWTFTSWRRPRWPTDGWSGMPPAWPRGSPWSAWQPVATPPTWHSARCCPARHNWSHGHHGGRRRRPPDR